MAGALSEILGAACRIEKLGAPPRRRHPCESIYG
jgi:hypothetical protein